MILVLGALVALGPLTIDVYLPARPAITDDLNSTDAAVQFTLTGTLIGLLNPFALVAGLVSVAMVVSHGAAMLVLKTNGPEE